MYASNMKLETIYRRPPAAPTALDVCVKAGDRVHCGGGWSYLVANTGFNEVSLINLNNGNRLSDPVPNTEGLSLLDLVGEASVKYLPPILSIERPRFN